MADVDLNLAVAFAGGFVSFASPCVLPLVPVYLGYMTGASMDKTSGRLLAPRAVVLLHALAFVLGFSLIFTVLFGASASVLGDLVARNKQLFQIVSGSLLIIFGLHTLGVFNIPFLNYEKRLELHPSKRLGYLRSLLIGIGFALGWTPCVGPILGAMLTLAMNQPAGAAVPLFFAYSMGLGIPFILAALLGRQLTVWMRKVMMRTFDLRVAGHTLLAGLNPISLVSGTLLVLMGLLLVSDRVTWLNQFLPQWSGIG
jgi:cytochrome c-type biogenesis protein